MQPEVCVEPWDGESWRLPKPDISPVFFGEMAQIHSQASARLSRGICMGGGTGKKSRSQLCSPPGESQLGSSWGWGHPQTMPGDAASSPCEQCWDWGCCVGSQPCEGLIKTTTTTTKYRQNRQIPNLFSFSPLLLPFPVFSRCLWPQEGAQLQTWEDQLDFGSRGS